MSQFFSAPFLRQTFPIGPDDVQKAVDQRGIRHVEISAIPCRFFHAIGEVPECVQRSLYRYRNARPGFSRRDNDVDTLGLESPKDRLFSRLGGLGIQDEPVSPAAPAPGCLDP